MFIIIVAPFILSERLAIYYQPKKTPVKTTICVHIKTKFAQRFMRLVNNWLLKSPYLNFDETYSTRNFLTKALSKNPIQLQHIQTVCFVISKHQNEHINEKSFSSVSLTVCQLKLIKIPVHNVYTFFYLWKNIYFSIIYGKYLAPSLGSTRKEFVNFIFFPFYFLFYEWTNDTNGRQCATEYQAPDRERCKGGKKEEENVHGWCKLDRCENGVVNIYSFNLILCIHIHLSRSIKSRWNIALLYISK